MRLEGVTAGNNKVNIDGIASRVELKAGDLYQMRNVTEPITHFGLGAAEQGDVLRVVWDERRSPEPYTSEGESAHCREADSEGLLSVFVRL